MRFGDDAERKAARARELPPEAPEKKRVRQGFYALREQIDRGTFNSSTTPEEIVALPEARSFEVSIDDLRRWWPHWFVLRTCRKCMGGISFMRMLAKRSVYFRCEDCGAEWSERRSVVPPGLRLEEGLQSKAHQSVDQSRRVTGLKKGIRVWPVGGRMRERVRRILKDRYGVEITDSEMEAPQEGVMADPSILEDEPEDFPDDQNIPF